MAPIKEFPPLEGPNAVSADESGIIAMGGDLHPESLLLAYRSGIFPWPDPDFPHLLWASPNERAVLFFDEIQIPKRTERYLRTHLYRITINKAFRDVVTACSRTPRPGQSGTWITPAMIDAYCEFHKLGFAQSIEVWHGEDLIGGLYGVLIGRYFSGESMFYTQPNASKIALLHWIEILKSKGVTWMDIQVMTPHMQKLGARLIPRSQFLDLLGQAIEPRI